MDGPDRPVPQQKMWIPAPPDIRSSANGALRLEQFVGIWPPTGKVGRWVHLTDLSDKALVLDTAPIHQSEIDWLDGNTLLLRIGGEGGQGMFRIDAEYRRFRNLASAGPGRPLAHLQAELLKEDEWIGDQRNRHPWCEREFSATGSFRIDWHCWESGHGMIRRAPKIVLTQSGDVLLDLSDRPGRWHGDAHFFRRPTGPSDGNDPENLQLFVSLDDFRKELWLRPVDNKGSIRERGEPSMALAELKRHLETRYSEWRVSRGFAT